MGSPHAQRKHEASAATHVVAWAARTRYSEGLSTMEPNAAFITPAVSGVALPPSAASASACAGALKVSLGAAAPPRLAGPLPGTEVLAILLVTLLLGACQ